MPVIAYLGDHKAETLERVVAAAAAFDAGNSVDERRFLLAAGSAGIRARWACCKHAQCLPLYFNVEIKSLTVFALSRSCGQGCPRSQP